MNIVARRQRELAALTVSKELETADWIAEDDTNMTGFADQSTTVRSVMGVVLVDTYRHFSNS